MNKTRSTVSHTTDEMIFQWDPDVPLVVDENIELPQLELIKNYTADCTQVYSTGKFALLWNSFSKTLFPSIFLPSGFHAWLCTVNFFFLFYFWLLCFRICSSGKFKAIALFLYFLLWHVLSFCFLFCMSNAWCHEERSLKLFLFFDIWVENKQIGGKNNSTYFLLCNYHNNVFYYWVIV